MATIPVGEVLEERPFNPRVDARTFTADPGPGNPRVPRGGFSAQGAATMMPPNAGPQMSPGARSLPTGPMGPIPGSQGLSTRAGQLAARAAPAVQAAGRVAGAGAAIGNFNSFKIDDPDVDSSATGTLRALRDGDFAGAGRSLSKGALETGMDLGTKVADLADIVLPGTPAMDRYRGFLKGQFGDQLIDNSQTSIGARMSMGPGEMTARDSSVPVRPVATPGAASAGAPPPIVMGPPGELASPGNVVTRVGNSFSGPDTGVRAGFTYAGGAPSRGVSVVGGGEGAAMDRQMLAEMQAERAAREANAPQAAGFSTGAGGSASAARFNEESLLDSLRQQAQGRGAGGVQLGPREQGRIAGAQRALAEFDQAQRGERIATAREAGDSARARMRDTTDRRNADLAAGVATRGQDIAAETAKGAREAAAAQARVEQMNKNRQYDLDVAKFGVERADTMLKQREEGRKAFNDQAGVLFPGADGKPDAQKIAQFANSVQTYLPTLVGQLKAQGNTAAAQRIEKAGLSGLDATDMASLKQLFDRMNAAEGGRSAIPFVGTSGARSSNLADYQITGRDNGLFTRGYKTAGGQSIRERDLDGSGFFGFGTPNADLMPTEEERRRLSAR